MVQVLSEAENVRLFQLWKTKAMPDDLQSPLYMSNYFVKFAMPCHS